MVIQPDGAPLLPRDIGSGAATKRRGRMHREQTFAYLGRERYEVFPREAGPATRLGSSRYG